MSNDGFLNTAGNAATGALIGSAIGGRGGAGWGAVIGALARPIKFNGGEENQQNIEGGAGCHEMTTKKYTTRNSPPYPANECRGKSKRGNDGKLWHSVSASNGIYRWQSSSKSPRKSPRKSPKKSPRKSPRRKSAKKWTKRQLSQSAFFKKINKLEKEGKMKQRQDMLLNLI